MARAKTPARARVAPAGGKQLALQRNCLTFSPPRRRLAAAARMPAAAEAPPPLPLPPALVLAVPPLRWRIARLKGLNWTT